ncbi:MAG: Ig-like domain-containing protein [Bacteroidota bacterium]
MKKFRFLLFLIPVLMLAACGSDDPVSPPPGGDTQKPSVSFVKPVNDQQVAGNTLEVKLNATDNIKVVKIELTLNNDLSPVATLTQEPWETTLDITALAGGINTITAKAYDSAGNASNRATISFERKVAGTFRFQFVDGAEFTSHRWDLADGNVKDEITRRNYVSRFVKGSGDMGGQSTWYRMISTDASTSRSDTMIAYTDAAFNVQVYGLANELVRRFTRPLIEQGILQTAPALPDPIWNYLVQVNDASGNSLALGKEWEITPPGGILIPLSVLNATITMTGKFVNKAQIFTVNGKDIYTWEILISVTIDVLGNKSVVPVHLWFSDDPSGQIMLQQETSLITVPIIGTFPVPGEQQELVSWK